MISAVPAPRNVEGSARSRLDRWTRTLAETDRLRGDRIAAIVLLSLAVFALGKVYLFPASSPGFAVATVAGALLGALLAQIGLRIAGVALGAGSCLLIPAASLAQGVVTTQSLAELMWLPLGMTVAALCLPLRSFLVFAVVDLAALVAVLGIASWIPGTVRGAILGTIVLGTVLVAVKSAAGQGSRRERRQAEAALAVSEQRFRTALEGTQDALYLLSACRGPGRRLEGFALVDLNRRAERELGRSRDEAILKRVETFGPAASLLGFQELYRRVLESGVAEEHEFSVPGVDGDPSWYRQQVAALFDGVAVFNRDISEYRRTSQALRESQERYRDLFENAPIGIYRTTPDGRFLLANPAAIRMAGCDSFSDLTANDLERQAESLFPRDEFKRRLEEEGLIEGLETAWRKRSGEIIHVRESARAVRDASGRIAYYDGVLEDITARRLAEESLGRSEAQSRAAARSLAESRERLLQQQDVLAALTRTSLREGDLFSGLGRIIEAAACTLGVERVSFWRFTLDGEAIHCLSLFERGPGRLSAGGRLEAAAYPAYFSALRESEVLIADDVTSDPRTREFVDTYTGPLGITAMMDVPVLLGGQLAGVLCHEQVAPARPWAPEDRLFGVAAGNLVSLVLEEADRRAAEQRLLRQNEYLAALHETTLGLLERRDVKTLLEAIVSRASTLLGTPDGFLYVLDAEAACLVQRAASGRFERWVGQRVGRGEGLAGRVWETGQPLVVHDYDRWDNRLLHLASQHVGAVVGVPLSAGGEVVGVLGLAYAGDEEVMKVDELVTLDRFGQLAALVLENTRLFEAAREELAERVRAEAEVRSLNEALEQRVELRTVELAMANASLRSSKARLGALLAAVPDVILRLDRSGICLDVSSGPSETRQAHGATVGEPLARSALPGPVVETLEAAISRSAATGVPETVEYSLPTPQGSRDYEARCVRAEGDEVVAIVRDVTDRKRAEIEQRQLRDAIERAAVEWLTSFDAVDSVMVLFDAEGRVRRLNRAARNLLGRDYREIVGLPVAELGTGEPWDCADRLVGLVRSSGLPQTGEVEDAASHRAWDVAADPVLADQGVVVLARDITRILALQESLRRTETLSTMGALVAGVAHEVRNPLFAISAALDAMDDDFGRDLRFLEYRPRLRSEVARLSRLMHELLEYGRPTTSTLVPGDLGEVVARGLTFVHDEAAAGRVDIVHRIEAGAYPMLLDGDRLVQVFQNLLLNAIQHTSAGGSITVSAQPFEAGGNPWVECRVEDSGRGFHEQDLTRVFQPFFTRRRGGTGLGLSIVQRIVEEHGGTVTAANRPEGGAVMTLRFPCSGDPADAGQATSPTRPAALSRSPPRSAP